MSKEFTSKDACRKFFIPGDKEETLKYCMEHLFSHAERHLNDQDSFSLALSGGSTPKALFQLLSQTENAQRIDWEKVSLFWGDERSVPLDHKDSNYYMAMSHGLEKLALDSHKVFPMHATVEIEENAQVYEMILRRELSQESLDFVMLGMGGDGHTASLFPGTKALNEKERLVVANEVPQLKTWRMTLTYPCLQRAKLCVFYVMGADKAEMLKHIYESNSAAASTLPSARIGNPDKPALWICDEEAGSLLS